MFPTQDISLSSTSTTGKTLSFDFSVGDFVVQDGKIVTLTGIEALKMWIDKVLRTEKNKFKIYNSDDTSAYGVSLLELLNSKYPQAYIQAQIQTSITNTLLTNSNITSVSNFIFTRDIKRTLTVTFTVNTTYGTTESEVIL